MRQYYKPLLISIIITLMIISGLLLFGTYDATQADTFDCERIRLDCVPRGPKPICPNMDLTPRCPLNAATKRRN
ncbi:hypothetical protein C6501_14700 [Candidatus Poribacteria bacterium]|nr:MAG: hypothetical protein C6501_14700 [Candidatus Poribacteria bacterium]